MFKIENGSSNIIKGGISFFSNIEWNTTIPNLFMFNFHFLLYYVAILYNYWPYTLNIIIFENYYFLNIYHLPVGSCIHENKQRYTIRNGCKNKESTNEKFLIFHYNKFPIIPDVIPKNKNKTKSLRTNVKQIIMFNSIN